MRPWLRAHLWLATQAGQTLREYYADCTSAELSLLEAWLDIDPQGGDRGDIKAGFMAVAAANANPYRKVGAKLDDYMPLQSQRRRRVEAIKLESTSRVKRRTKRQTDAATFRQFAEKWNKR